MIFITRNPEYLAWNEQDITVNTDITELEKELDSCLFISLDTETSGLRFTESRLLLVQVYVNGKIFIIDPDTIYVNKLKSVIENSKILKILQNAAFDYGHLKHNGYGCLTNVYDTMLVEKVIYTGLKTRTSLDQIINRYLGINISKELQTSFIGKKGIAPDQIRYAGLDVKYLHLVKEAQDVLMADKKDRTDIIVAHLENTVCPILAEVSYEGLELDVRKWLSLSSFHAEEKASIYAKVEDYLDSLKEDPKKAELLVKYQNNVLDLFLEDNKRYNINLASPKQVKDFLKDVLDIETESVGKQFLVKNMKHPFIKLYSEYITANKKETAFGAKFLTKYIHSDNKVHTNFVQMVRTGRMASKEPNMQQIPGNNTYRNCFIAPKNYVFVSSDYSSQELCVIAHGSQDPVWIEALIKNQDLHSICAALIFGEQWATSANPDCSFERTKQKCHCPKHEKLRKAAKSINFGLSYGMGFKKLSNTLDIPEQEAKDLIDKFFEVFPSIKNYLEGLAKEGVSKGYITTMAPYKRKRYFDGWNGQYTPKALLGSFERQSKNTPIQGSSADMIKEALINIDRAIKKDKLPVKIVMVVHDQIDTICHKSFAPEWKKRLTYIMEETAKTIIPTGYLKAETTITEQWSK